MLRSLCNKGDNATDEGVCCVIAFVHDHSGTAFIHALCRLGIAFSVSVFSYLKGSECWIARSVWQKRQPALSYQQHPGLFALQSR